MGKCRLARDSRPRVLCLHWLLADLQVLCNSHLRLHGMAKSRDLFQVYVHLVAIGRDMQRHRTDTHEELLAATAA